jgi:hypothetical protein
MLDQLLEYTQSPPAEDFVDSVMQRVKREQRIRKLILVVTGLTGAIFGVTGALMLSDSITQLVSRVPSGNGALPVGIIIMGVVGVVTWLLNDDIDLAA